MKFSEMPYARPDLDELKQQLQALTDQLKSAPDYASAHEAFLAQQKLSTHIDTLATLSSVRNSIDTRDKFYDAEEQFWNEAGPELRAYDDAWTAAMLESPFRKDFAAEYGDLMFVNAEIGRKAFSPAIVEELKQENQLVQDYQKLIAGAQIDFEGSTYTISQLSTFKNSPDDAVRLAAWKAEGGWYKAHQPELDEIYDKLVRLRDAMGRKLGYDGFTQLGYYRMGRNCYTKEDVEKFRAAVVKYVVPVASSIYREQAARLGKSYPMNFADNALMFRSGNPKPCGTPAEILAQGNSFYTTAANRIARDVLPDAVTPEDVIAACGGAVEPEPPLPEYQRIPPAPEKATRTVKKLPVWRKLLAAVSGAASLALIVQAIGVTDLTKLIDANGMTALAGGQLKLYGILLAALLVFALSIGRKADRPDYLVQTPLEKRKLQKRTVTATLLILLLIPLTLFVGVYYFAGRKYYFISLLILLECMLPFFLIFEGRKPQARELVLIAVLVALNVAGRAAFFMLPEFKPVVAMTILAGVAFGGETGFLVGAMTMLVSNMLFSQGPWTPWQMFAMGIIGWLAGVLYRKGVLRRGRLSLCIFGVIASTIIYGGIMNPASALMWSNTINWKIILSYYVTGLPVDLVRAIATFFFLWLIAEPMLEKLDRIKTKYGLAE